ncbi:MarR family winged helix-turn-helix transcriptional regulator [Lysinibacter cavernae]|uniref:DNA-binding MarR family transcriptional regulator n=1 Tax=Lysinibacter cavernae TaxID=1640652 RepID=A0A7X5TSN3_9MICO|nr:MarR family winged helix-turn-helix transcriptional regulator [Lysinibacter cavernae]NIH53230.1 DNA-binding MarR family transcriptional regulator [Lysinibacter cavernae]
METRTSAQSTVAGSEAAPRQAGAAASAMERFIDTDLGHDIDFLLARARAARSAATNALLEPLDLRVRSYSVLSLACSDTNPSQKELAQFLDLDPSQIVALIDRLEERGLVRREPDPRDRRSNVIRATTAGKALYAEAGPLVAQSQELAMSSLTARDRERLFGYLKLVAFHG